MSLQTGLNVVTIVMCIITLIMATAALMPQIKQGLVLLRDGLMWTFFLAMIGVIGLVGWGRFYEVQQQRGQRSEPQAAEPTEVVHRTEPVAEQGFTTEPVSKKGFTNGLVAEQGFTANRSVGSGSGGVDLGTRQWTSR